MASLGHNELMVSDMKINDKSDTKSKCRLENIDPWRTTLVEAVDT